MENLPDEILVNILKYLNTFELIQFCEAYKYLEYLLRERKLIHRVNLSKTFQIYELNIPSLINSRLDPNLIQILNINSLYWIPIADLTRILNKLNNLKELYALDTKLGFSKKMNVYTKLRKLALTITEADVESDTLLNLKFLCIKIVLTDGSFNFQQLFNEKWQLQELWIANEERVLNYEIIPYILKDLNKLVVRSKSFSPFYDFSHFGLYMIFQCSRNESEIQFIYEKVPKVNRSISMFEPVGNDLEESWEVLHRHNKDLSCGPKEAERLFLEDNINNINFEELNFGHSIILCQSKYIEAASKILLSKNTTDLKKLHFRTCLFQRTKKEFGEKQTCEFKKPRYEVKVDKDDPFEHVARHVKKLKELEIYFCSGCCNFQTLTSYHSISFFQNLEKLTLEVPLSLDGSFLKEVVKNCQKLSSLKLTLTSQNENFMSRLCESLKYSNSLRDFRLNHVQIHIEKLLNSFNEIQSKKLQRLFIKCDNLRYNNNLETQPFNQFLITNPQLVFLFIIVHKNTVKQNSNIQKIFNEHKKGNSAKIFYIKKDYSFSGYFPVPTAHHDMIYKNTNISVINFDEF